MWVVLAVLAGLLQVLRNASSRSLGRTVPHALNTWVRFAGSGLLCGIVLLPATVAWGWPRLPAAFWAWTAACACCQSLANLCLVAALRAVPFSRAVTLHKLEVALTPIVGMALFAELPSALGLAGIGLCALGAIALNAAARLPGEPLSTLWRFDRGSCCALGSAAGVVLASFFLKQATEAWLLANPEVPAGRGHFLAALHTLVHAALLQAAVLGAFLLRRGPAAFRPLRGQSRAVLRLMLASAACSLCWFWAYALALVAYVKAVGQVELLAAAALGRLRLGETGLRRRLPALLLVLTGILLVLLG